jgi:hypothetical protein
MKTNFKPSVRTMCYSRGAAICAGVVLLIASSVQAQNLFVSSYTSSGPIYEFTLDGVQSTYVSGLPYTEGLAFDSAGDLLVGIQNLGAIYKYTPGGVQSTFASGLNGSLGLAFDGTGNLFVADAGSGHIYKYTPGGTRSTFASGLSAPEELAFQGETLPVPEPSALGLIAVGVTALFSRRRYTP